MQNEDKNNKKKQKKKKNDLIDSENMAKEGSSLSKKGNKRNARLRAANK